MVPSAGWQADRAPQRKGALDGRAAHLCPGPCLSQMLDVINLGWFSRAF